MQLGGILRVAIVIPTKQRADALCHVVETLCRQTASFGQLIVVDQSVRPDAKAAVSSLLRSRPETELLYIHDRRPTNAGIARNLAMTHARSDILLFLDDDVGLEPDFLDQLLAVYTAFPDAVGVCGIITNYSPARRLFRLWERCFALGPFFDERQPLYWRAETLRTSQPIRVTKFTGALMSFRVDRMEGIQFDERIAAAGEDTDLSVRIGGRSLLLLAPKARLAHYRSPINRSGDHWLKRYVETQHFLYRKLWSTSIVHHLAYAWLRLGCMAVAGLAGLRRGDLSPFRAYGAGIQTAERWLSLPTTPAYTRTASGPNVRGSSVSF